MALSPWPVSPVPLAVVAIHVDLAYTASFPENAFARRSGGRGLGAYGARAVVIETLTLTR